MKSDQAERIRRLLLQSQAALDQTEEQARELQVQFERLAEFGPDGSAHDAMLSKAAATLLCVWLDASAAQRAVQVEEHEVEDRAGGPPADRSDDATS